MNIAIVIDDCELLKISLSKVLSCYMDEFYFYTNVSDALNKLKHVRGNDQYLFLVDLETVTSEGMDAIIRAMPKPFSEIILLTSLPPTYVSKDASKPEVLRLFTKPFIMNELERYIKTYISKT
ncbi:MAG: hypothetical protein M1381_10075 [Deltaproteobacteria bacterium]|nr:hypothetical protein [Deltaproteobacteria bacterium]MCL5791617.1 hypothetical protein [Deltaproteobacteria bacterium]